MTQVETQTMESEAAECEADETETVDPMEVIYQGQCESLSGRSFLSFAIASHTEDETLHLRITGNSGRGMWCKLWASAAAIEEIAIGASELTAKSFNALHPGRSTNTGGFYLAALRTLGLLQVREDNARFHAHVPATTFASVVKDTMAAAGKAQKRKPKEG